jgi:hypothetical protein
MLLHTLALLVGLTGCAATPFRGSADRSVVHTSAAARECGTASETARSFDAPPKMKRVARAALSGVIGGVGGAVVGAGAALVWAGSLAPACVDPTICLAGVGAVATIGAAVGGVVGAVAGAKTAWDESSGVAGNFHACNAGPEIRPSGDSSGGETEPPHGSRSET